MPAQAYFETDGVGDWYDAVAATGPGQSPGTHPELWSKLELPACLEMAIVSEAVAYLQRADGQLDKAVAQARIFEVELERLILQHGDFGTHTQPAVFSR